ncbi:glycosyltransferase [Tetragenococcus halophilus]|uniref:glycosyltransferase n=1 Tax=Tetragenococcus halophilus TaxID=51669 RepID=UPI0030C97038
MEKKKLLFVISNLNIGGPQKSLLALLDNIDYDIFDVDVCVLRPDGELASFFNKNVNFIDVSELLTAATLPSENIVYWLKVLLKQGQYRMFSDAIISIARHIFLKRNMNQERQKFWRKHANQLPKFSKEYDLSFGILGLSTYVIVDLVSSMKKFHWVRSDVRILNRNTEIDGEYYNFLTGALAVSKKCGEIFENMYPHMRNKTKVFYNYIPEKFYNNISFDSSLIEKNNDETTILTVTRLDPLKGIELAIEACRILVDDGINIKWYVLGNGKYRKKVEELIKEKGLQNKFILLGFQLNTLEFIKNVDIFVHPSRTEGKSNAVDEAKFVGKPIVVTNYDTVSEQIEDKTTGLIADMTGKSIALALERLIDDKELQLFLAKNCLNSKDASEQVTEDFLKLIKEWEKGYVF